MKEIDHDSLSLLQNPIIAAGSITIGATALKVMDYNLDRRLAIIVNDSASNLYLGFGSIVTANTGIRLNSSGGSFEFGLYTTFPWLGEIWAIAAGAGNILTFVEV